MKTKFLFFSTVLAAAALTACTNEDFVENPAGVDMGGEKVNISIAASKGGDAATRIGINPDEDGSLAGATPYWQASDMLGGLLYTSPDGSGMLTNYPFTPAQEIAEGEQPTTMTFQTPTAVSKGSYVFYTPYKRDFIDNTTFKVTLPDRQEMDPENPTAHLGENDFMVSPGISLAGIKYGDKNELPIQFSSIYNYTRIHITLKEAQEPVTIQRIVFKANSATPNQYDDFKTTAQIVPQKLMDAVNGITDKWSDGEAIGSTSVINTNGEIVASKAEVSDYQQAAAEFKVPVGALTDVVSQDGSTKAIVLAIKGGVTLNAGESFNAYVLLPYGTYANGINYDIYTNKGIAAKRTLGSSTDPNHSVTLRAGRSAAMEDEVNYTLNNNSFDLPMIFDIASDQDWLDAVSYVTENYGMYGNTTNWKTPTFYLLKNVKGSMPNFAVNVVTGTNTKLTLTGSNILNGDYAYDLSQADIVNTGNLTVAGTTATSAKTFTVKSLTNSGTVTVNGKLTVTGGLENTGTVTNAGITTVNGTTINGDAKAAAVLTNTGSFTSIGALTNKAKATVNVNYANTNTKFVLNAASTNVKNAAINIADKAELNANAAGLTNKGTITLNNTANLNGGTALNNKEGVIVITDASKTYKLTVPTSGNAGVIKTTVATLNAIKAAANKTDKATANELINRIELTSSIKVEADLNLTTDVQLSLAKGVNLQINDSKTITCAELVVAGAGTSVTAYDKAGLKEEPTATLTAAKVTVEQGAGLTVAEGVTVGSTVSALTVNKNASLTNNGTIAATNATTTISVSVETGASLVNGEEGAVTGQFSITKNAGQIVNNNDAEITVTGGMVGKMEGAFTFTK